MSLLEELLVERFGPHSLLEAERCAPPASRVPARVVAAESWPSSAHYGSRRDAWTRLRSLKQALHVVGVEHRRRAS